MVTSVAGAPHDQADTPACGLVSAERIERLRDSVASAARREYAAECQLHDAHSSHIDGWNGPAADLLHRAIQAHTAAVAALASALAARS